MRKMNNYVLLLFVLFAQGAMAQLRLPAIFGDGMVMQREQSIPVWGWGTPGEKVKVVLANKTKTVKVGKNGRWSVTFPAMKAGGPYTLDVSTNTQHLTPNTLFIGDVFLFSGQSNQELPIGRCMDNNKVATLANNYTNANVHILKLPQQQNLCKPQDDCKGAQWVSISPETAKGIAALSYLVGKELQEATDVPVGIINSSVGGTRVEAWMSRENLMQFPEMQKELTDIKYHQTNWRDSVNKVQQAAISKWYADMHAADSIENRCLKTGYDFSSWQPVNIFDKWYSGVQPNGSYWFHNSFVLSAQAALSLKGRAGRELSTGRTQVEAFLLRLGAMKDHDEVYVNGVKVGDTGYQYPPRKYMVPASVLREGVNDVVIHLTSQSGEPNFTLAKAYQLEAPDGAVLLDKGWTMAIGKTMPQCPPSTYFVDTPVGLYNAMINPLGPLAIKGMVWYQGEANEGHPCHYREYLQAMIDEWHKQFRGNWPSVIVQLASFRDRHEGAYQSGWCDVRDQQYDISEQTANSQQPTPNTFLATAIDCGEWNDIHPQDKITISHRVALQLRHHVYDEPLISEGPRPVSCEKRGSEIVVRFSHETGKLRPIYDGIAKVTGDYELTIDIPAAIKTASSTYTIVDDTKTNASLFRYAHDDYPLCTIYNTDGLPAAQFSIEIK